MIGLLRRPAVDEVQVGITVISQDSGAAIHILRGVHKGIPYGQVCGRGSRAREVGMSPLNNPPPFQEQDLRGGVFPITLCSHFSEHSAQEQGSGPLL